MKLKKSLQISLFLVRKLQIRLFMNIKIEQKIGARFKLIVRKKSNNDISKESGWFLNNVLDTGLNQMSKGIWVNRCCVGSGNSTPQNTQIQLDNFVASTTIQQAGLGVVETTNAPYYWGYRTTWRFVAGIATGNLSEVGLGWDDNNLWNRALIKDTAGNPTTITVLSDEYLDVVSEVRVYPANNFTGSFNLLDKNGATVSTHTYTGKPYIKVGVSAFGQVKLAGTNGGFSVYSGNMGATVTTPPSPPLLGNVDNPANTYPTDRSVRFTATLGLSVANGEHKSFYVALWASLLMQGGGFQMQISPTINKNNAQIMTYTVELTWGRYVA